MDIPRPPVPKLPEGVLPFTHPDRPYVPPAHTNVQNTWRKHGWVPPSEVKNKE